MHAGRMKFLPGLSDDFPAMREDEHALAAVDVTTDNFRRNHGLPGSGGRDDYDFLAVCNPFVFGNHADLIISQ